MEEILKQKEQGTNSVIPAIETISVGYDNTEKLCETLYSLTLKNEEIDRLKENLEKIEQNKIKLDNALV